MAGNFLPVPTAQPQDLQKAAPGKSKVESTQDLGCAWKWKRAKQQVQQSIWVFCSLALLFATADFRLNVL